MNEPEVFELADRTLNGVVAQITDEQWDTAMPASFAMRTAEGVPTLWQVIAYHAYDDAWVPDMLAGRTMEEVGKDAFDGDLLGADPRGSFAELVEKACAAARRVSHLEATVHCSFGGTTRPGSTSGRSTASGVCGPTTSPWSSGSTRPCPGNWSRGCGRRSVPTPRSGGPSGSSPPPCR